ncbi:carbon-nitrogen hydrolase [Tuber brumale]|nr:carbon-nitrogen hydrolase [Tuber brumale]
MFRRAISSLASISPFPAAASSKAMTSPLKRPVKLALIQLATGSDKDVNLKRASEKVAEAAKNGANIVVLPECFNSPYGTEHFPNYAEPIPTPTRAFPTSETPSYTTLSTLASTHKIYLIGGSIPELDPETSELYNTSLTFSPTGALLATHRKIHLFDIDIPGKIKFIESDVLSPGSTPTLILTEYGSIGLGICYDIRFPELTMIAARKGAFLVIYPGAFNMTTGPMHWELLARARAADNQVYVGVCSPARRKEEDGEGYTAWGHSMIVDPNAEVVVTTEEKEGIVEWELKPERISEVRKGIPISGQRRFDVYADVAVAGPTKGIEE